MLFSFFFIGGDLRFGMDMYKKCKYNILTRGHFSWRGGSCEIKTRNCDESSQNNNNSDWWSWWRRREMMMMDKRIVKRW